MFTGAIPADLRSVVAEHVQTWKPADLYVACSGNFTIERAALAAHPPVRAHGNDVSIYTCALGNYFTGRPVGVTLREEWEELLGWLHPYLDDGVGSIATIMLGTRFLQAAMKPDNRYYQRLLGGWRDQFPQLHARTVEKVKAVALPLASFTPMDCRAYLDDVVPGDAPVMTFPPFDKGGYTNLYKPLDETLQWTPPEFEEMSQDDVDAMIDAVTDRPRWLIGLSHEIDALAEHKRAVVKTSPRARAMYVYSSEGAHRFTRARQVIRPVMAPKLAPDQEIGGKITLARLEGAQVDALRAQYLDRRIAPGSVSAGVGVLVDGHLIGCYAFREAVSSFDPDCAYLMADFAIRPTRYKNLAKLVLCAAVSNESKLLIERIMNRRLRHITTTAFADRPVSMKYRNLFRLDQRRDADDGVHRYVLNYSSQLGRWSLDEGFAMWRDRWGQTR